MGEEIEFKNGPKWPNFRLSCATDLDLGSGHGHYLFSSLIEYYLYTKFHRNRRNILWTDGRTDGNLPPIVLGRLPKFGNRPNKYQCFLVNMTVYMGERKYNLGHLEFHACGILLHFMTTLF